ncbi:MAG: sigma-70 family RNA polymerase sigma factor [Bacteroidales bacterium]|nr:sigma-70 family RNA polymerase sigma factor [Bacteroidales bacterium]
MRYKILSEEELIEEALNGSEAHLNLLISMYEPFIVEHISRQIKNYQDLLDLRQHVCCRIAKQISEKNYVHQDKFSNWAGSIIKNEVNNYFRRKKQGIILHYFSPDFLDEFTENHFMAAEDTLAFTPNLSFYVDQLPDEQAAVVKLKCFQDKTFREISELLKVPINTVMGRYRYGIERIREMIGH